MAVQDRTRLIDAAHDRIRARFPGAVLACQKSIFDKLADGGVSAPPGAAPQIFNLSRGSFAKDETQSADKARKRKNCPEQREIRGNFCFLRQLHMQPAVTYVYVSSLACKFASLSCRLSHPSGSLLTLSTS